jgi:hypothetical protein
MLCHHAVRVSNEVEYGGFFCSKWPEFVVLLRGAPDSGLTQTHSGRSRQVEDVLFRGFMPDGLYRSKEMGGLPGWPPSVVTHQLCVPARLIFEPREAARGAKTRTCLSNLPSLPNNQESTNQLLSFAEASNFSTHTRDRTASAYQHSSHLNSNHGIHFRPSLRHHGRRLRHRSCNRRTTCKERGASLPS